MSTERDCDAASDGPSGSPARTASGERTVARSSSEESTLRFATYNAGVFAAVGVGFALALILLDELIGSEAPLGYGSGDTFFVIGVFVLFFFSPVLAGVTGSITSIGQRDSEGAVVTAASTGTFLGYIVVLMLIVATGNVLAAEGVGTVDMFRDSLLPLLGFGVGVAVAGGFSAFVTERFAGDA